MAHKCNSMVDGFSIEYSVEDGFYTLMKDGKPVATKFKVCPYCGEELEASIVITNWAFDVMVKQIEALPAVRKLYSNELTKDNYIVDKNKRTIYLTDVCVYLVALP